MKIASVIFIIIFGLGMLALLRAASKADDHAEIMKDFKEEK
jgi:hypothetical protein